MKQFIMIKEKVMKGPNYFKPDLKNSLHDEKLSLDTARDRARLVIYLVDKYIF